MSSCFGTDVTGQVRILSCNVRRGTLHYQSMKISEVAFRNWRKLLCYLPNVTNRVVMIEGFKVIFQRFPADRNTFLDDQGGFNGTEGIALNGIRGVREFDIVIVLDVGKRLRR